MRTESAAQPMFLGEVITEKTVWDSTKIQLILFLKPDGSEPGDQGDRLSGPPGSGDNPDPDGSGDQQGPDATAIPDGAPKAGSATPSAKTEWGWSPKSFEGRLFLPALQNLVTGNQNAGITNWLYGPVGATDNGLTKDLEDTKPLAKLKIAPPKADSAGNKIVADITQVGVFRFKSGGDATDKKNSDSFFMVVTLRAPKSETTPDPWTIKEVIHLNAQAGGEATKTDEQTKLSGLSKKMGDWEVTQFLGEAVDMKFPDLLTENLLPTIDLHELDPSSHENGPGADTTENEGAAQRAGFSLNKDTNPFTYVSLGSRYLTTREVVLEVAETLGACLGADEAARSALQPLGVHKADEAPTPVLERGRGVCFFATNRSIGLVTYPHQTVGEIYEAWRYAEKRCSDSGTDSTEEPDCVEVDYATVRLPRDFHSSAILLALLALHQALALDTIRGTLSGEMSENVRDFTTNKSGDKSGSTADRNALRKALSELGEQERQFYYLQTTFRFRAVTPQYGFQTLYFRFVDLFQLDSLYTDIGSSLRMLSQYLGEQNQILSTRSRKQFEQLTTMFGAIVAPLFAGTAVWNLIATVMESPPPWVGYVIIAVVALLTILLLILRSKIDTITNKLNQCRDNRGTKKSDRAKKNPHPRVEQPD